MAYTNIDFKTKKELREAVKAGQKVTVQRDAFGGSGCYRPGKAAISGPQYPKAHTWHADCDVNEEGVITKVR